MKCSLRLLTDYTTSITEVGIYFSTSRPLTTVRWREYSFMRLFQMKAGQLPPYKEYYKGHVATNGQQEYYLVDCSFAQFNAFQATTLKQMLLPVDFKY